MTHTPKCVEASNNTSCKVSALWIYPVKSMGGFSTHQWAYTSTGFKYDRQWAVVDSRGIVVTQKKVTAMARIQAKLDLEATTLRLKCYIKENNPEASSEFALRLTPQTIADEKHCYCANGKKWIDEGDSVAEWLSMWLNCNCRLVRQPMQAVGNHGTNLRNGSCNIGKRRTFVG